MVEVVEEQVGIVEKLTDNAISILMTITVLAMAVMAIPVPEWLIAAFGIVLAFYFKQ